MILHVNIDLMDELSRTSRLVDDGDDKDHLKQCCTTVAYLGHSSKWVLKKAGTVSTDGG